MCHDDVDHVSVPFLLGHIQCRFFCVIGRFLQRPYTVVSWHQFMVDPFHPFLTEPPHYWCAPCIGRPVCFSWYGTPSLQDFGC